MTEVPTYKARGPVCFPVALGYALNDARKGGKLRVKMLPDYDVREFTCKAWRIQYDQIVYRHDVTIKWAGYGPATEKPNAS